MRLVFYPDQSLLTCSIIGKVRDIEASSDVRNELNKRRPLHDPKGKGKVILAMGEDPHYKPPVMPRTFPHGTWTVGKPRPKTNPYLAPYYIPTDAEQYLDIWALDDDGGYDHPTEERVLDMYYGLHFSTSSTTVGCIKIHELRDLEWLVDMWHAEAQRKEETTITVR
jgi:hypothetical protein